MTAHSILQRLHRWAGLTVGAVFAVMGLSGSALVFKDAILEHLYPEIMHVPSSGEAASPSRLIAAASQVGTAAYLRFPDHPNQPVRARVTTPDGAPADLLLHPGTAEIIGPLPGRVFLVLSELHVRLLSGAVGHTVVGVVGLLFIATVLPGIVLWWPRPGQWRTALTLKRGAGARRRVLDLHKLGGVVLALPLLLTAVTGAVMVFRQSLTPVVAALGGPVSKPAAAPTVDSGRTIDGMLDEARRRLPDGRITLLTLPKQPGGSVQVRVALPGEIHPNGRSVVQFDGAGRLLAVQRAPDQPMANWVFDQLPYPVHIGVAFGLGGQLTVLAGGLALSALYGTGLWLWLRARRRQAQARAQAKALPGA